MNLDTVNLGVLVDVARFLARFAETALGAFVIAVLLDNVLGVAVSVKQGNFSLQKLPSFLGSQFGTKAFLSLLAMVVGAYFANLQAPDAGVVLLSVVTGGAAALTAGVLGDVKDKVAALVGKAPPPVPGPPPPPVG